MCFVLFLYVFPTVSVSIDVCVFCVCLCVPSPWSVSQHDLYGGTGVHPQMGCEAERVQTAPGRANLSTHFHNNVFLHTWSNITATKELSSGGQIISQWISVKTLIPLWMARAELLVSFVRWTCVEPGQNYFFPGREVIHSKVNVLFLKFFLRFRRRKL